MMNIQKTSKYIEDKALFAEIWLDIKKTLYAGNKIQTIGKLYVKLDYSCDKLLGKCCNEGRILAEKEEEQHINIQIRLDSIEYNGKLVGQLEDNNITRVIVRRGKGKGSLSLTYNISAKVVNAGRYAFQVHLYYETKKGEKKLIQTIPIEFEVIKPIVINTLKIEPSANKYFIGDLVKLRLELVSRYEGMIFVDCGGALEQQRHTLKISRETREIVIDAKIRKSTDGIKISISIPELDFMDSITRELLIGGQRIDIRDVKISEAIMGKNVSVSVALINFSEVSESRIRVKVSIYGFDFNTHIVLGPNETKTLEYTTPTLSKEKPLTLEGEIYVVEEYSNQELRIQLKLNEPVPPAVRYEVESSKKIPSNASHKLHIFVYNESDLDVEIQLNRSSSEVCKVLNEGIRVKIPPSEQKPIEIVLKPLIVGKGALDLEFVTLVNDMRVGEHVVKINVEIYNSFKIEASRIVSPSKTRHVVKGQPIIIEIDLDVYYDEVELEVRSSDLELEKTKYVVYYPRDKITITGRVISNFDNTKIILSDGLISEEIQVPFKVLKPIVKYVFDHDEIFLGLRQRVRLRFTNELEIPVKVKLKIVPTDFIKMDTYEIETDLPPLSYGVETYINVMGLKIGSCELKYTIACHYVDVLSNKVLDEWSESSKITLTIKSPLKITITKHIEEFLIPYPVREEHHYRILSSVNAEISLENITNTPLTDIFIESHTRSKDISIKLEPSGITFIEPGREKKINIKINIPAGYPYDHIDVDLKIKLNNYIIYERTLKANAKKYNYALLEFVKATFKEEECIYPYMSVGEKVYVFMPLFSNNYQVCGEPLKESIDKHKIMSIIYKYLNELQPSISSPWETVASILFSRATLKNLGFDRRLVISEYTKFVGEDIIIVPGLLWIITIGNLTHDNEILKNVSTLLKDEDSLGIIYVKKSSLYRTHNTIYNDLLSFILKRDMKASEKIYKRLETLIKEERGLDPLLLIYIINNGKRIKFDSSMVDRLLIKNGSRDLIVYLAVSDVSLNNIASIQDKVLKAIGELIKSRDHVGILALSILFYRFIHEFAEKIGEQ